MGMGSPKSSAFVLQICLVLMLVVASSAQLNTGFYSLTCPLAHSIIILGVASAIRDDFRMGASLLRLHFVDCFVNGCDGSVLLDDNSTFTGEKTATQNINSIRGFDVIDTIKSKLEDACLGVVSCADILALAAQTSVMMSGGPGWTVQLGRRDALTTSLSAANSNLPAPTMDLSELLTSFHNKGLTTRDFVALSGAHTIGKARCTTFRSRIYNETNIDSTYATNMKKTCPSASGPKDNDTVSLDNSSPNYFDNKYFQNLENSKGLLHSDQQLLDGQGETSSIVSLYARERSRFRSDFARAMIKMGNLGVITGVEGEIRTNCRRAN